MTIWERLGISRTADIKAIKRAYAKQLKVYHPEDDPRGYQALREAFDAALSSAKREASREEVVEYEELQDDDESKSDIEPQTLLVPRINLSQLNHEHIQPEDNEQLMPPPRIPLHANQSIWQHVFETEGSSSPETDYNTVPEFVEAIIALYEHFPSRISKDKWLELLNSSVMWNIDFKLQIRNQLMFILEDRKLFLPTEIWLLLESSLDLENTIQESIDFDDDHNPNSIWSYYLRQLKYPGLRYEFLLQTDDLDYDQFLQLRDQGYAALSQNDLKQAETCLKRAFALFADDPDLLRLLGECCIRTAQYEAALAYFDQLIRLLPEEIDGHLYKARIWYYMGQTSQTAEQCQYILSKWPKNSDTVILLSHCRMSLGNPGEAEELLNKAVQLSDRNQSTSEEQPNLVKANRANRRNWKLLFNKNILLHMIIMLVTSALIIGCINYYWNISIQNTPFIVTSLKDLELINEQEYTALSVTNLQDININHYAGGVNSFDSGFYENSAYAFRHFDEYGNPTYRVYLGEFNGQHIIVFADPATDVLSIQSGTAIKGYVHAVSSRLESAVTHMLRWKPSNPEGTPEAKLELYNKSIAIGFDTDYESNSAPVPEINQKYIEISDPKTKSPVNKFNIATLGLIIAIWIRSLYYLVFECRKIRGTL
ncbi:tetratricopeptide (TPR) repeat protein [Fontibacillus solani]|uniref:Tetratricopeptide (TPR) repeat protein n=1 Tax=Fontibacillus solani TaxID=1572857 RepID=A0A7W3SP95_9BACL|nr:tetratricopeptide repeat protein [Fontibacillus solani]MBA9083712.1 tetratricopeptide (TPR) repeat protein [Fontibacillus solani]